MKKDSTTPGQLIGYARVSTPDRDLRDQIERLTAAGCVQVFKDVASGTRASRPDWDRCLQYLRPGDTLLITRLDRVGRSVLNLSSLVDELGRRGVTMRALDQSLDTGSAQGRLMVATLAAIAEYERELISERTKDTLRAKRARGESTGGRPPADKKLVERAQQLYDKGELTVEEIARTVGLSKATLYRKLNTIYKQTRSARVRSPEETASAR